MGMQRILFVCLGNICRSPIAEYLLRTMARDAGRDGDFLIESAATSDENVFRGVGAPVYPPARELLRRHGIDCSGKRARQVTKDDYTRFDRILCMDDSNVRNLRRIFGGDPDGKIQKLLDLTDRPGNVADPWYTGDFETAFCDIEEGCRAILNEGGETQ